MADEKLEIVEDSGEARAVVDDGMMARSTAKEEVLAVEDDAQTHAVEAGGAATYAVANDVGEASLVAGGGGEARFVAGEGRAIAEGGEGASPADGGCGGMQAAAAQAQVDSEDDVYLTYLTREYRKYRIWTLVLAIAGFSTILLTIGLQQTGIIQVRVFNLMMSVANLFIVLMLVVAFTRTRPFRKKVKSYDKYYVSVVDPDAEDGVRMEERSFPDMDDFFKIFERRARTELIPDTNEYRSLRKTWLALFAAAAVVAVVSIALYLAVPALSLVSSIMLLAAFVLVAVAFYFDRTRMRPLRTKWSKDNFGLAEFQVRDRMAEMESGALSGGRGL